MSWAKRVLQREGTLSPELHTALLSAPHVQVGNGWVAEPFGIKRRWNKVCNSRRYIVVALLLASVVMPVQAFKDPLDTPAAISAVEVPLGRLTGVTTVVDRLVAVGPWGRILVSANEGRTWQQVPVPVSSDLVAVHFATRRKGWVVGHDGVVLHTDDGGQSWIKQLDGKQAAKIIQTYFEKQVAQGSNEAAKIMDEVRKFVVEGADKPFLDLMFLNEREGFIVGAFNLSFRTRDGGATWEPLNNRTDNSKGLHLYAMASLGDDVYIVGEQGLIRRWNHANEHFESLNSPYKGSYFGVIGKDSTLIVFGMQGNVYRSTDRGNSWAKLNSPITESITGGTFLEDGRFVLATQGGRLLVSLKKGEGLTAVQPSNPMPYFAVAPMQSNRIALVGAQGVRIEFVK